MYLMLCDSGPDLNMAGVRISGTHVSQLVTSPATVMFDITDDAVAVEVDEKYFLTLIPTDPSVIVQEPMTKITITDNVDSKSATRIGLHICCLIRL